MNPPLELTDWELPEPPVLPLRSRLYHLEPIGIGTPMVESLSGYICRLAAAHNLRPWSLVTRVMSPMAKVPSLMAKGSASDCYVFGQTASTSISSIGAVSADAVRITEELTRQQNLQRLTMEFATDILSTRDLLGPQKWCPACLHDWEQDRRPIYLPLIWQFRSAKICTTHHTPLEGTCRYCGAPHFPFHHSLRPGFCPCCRNWMGSPVSSPSTPPFPCDHAHVVTRQLEQLLLHGERIRAAGGGGWARSIQWIATNWFPHTEGFSRAIGLCPKSVRGWLSGALPSLTSVVQVAFQLRVRVVDLLLGDVRVFAALHPRRRLRLLPVARKRNKKHDLETVEKVLQQAALGDEVPPPSLAVLSKRTGVHQSFLSRKFPILATQIKAKYEAYQTTQCEARRAYIDATVRALVATIAAGGEYPGRVKMRKMLPKSISLFDKVALAAWKSELAARNLTIDNATSKA